MTRSQLDRYEDIVRKRYQKKNSAYKLSSRIDEVRSEKILNMVAECSSASEIKIENLEQGTLVQKRERKFTSFGKAAQAAAEDPKNFLIKSNEESVSQRTVMAYNTSVRKYHILCETMNWGKEDKLTEERLRIFSAVCEKDQRASHSAAQYVINLRCAYKILEKSAPGLGEATRGLAKRLGANCSPPKQNLPIGINELICMAHACHLVKSRNFWTEDLKQKTITGRQFYDAMVMTFFVIARIDDMADIVVQKESSHVILSKGCTKTRQHPAYSRKPHRRPIALVCVCEATKAKMAGTNLKLCPYCVNHNQALETLKAPYNLLIDMLRDFLTAIGTPTRDLRNFGTHSLRVDSTRTAFLSDVSVMELMDIATWQSEESVSHYLNGISACKTMTAFKSWPLKKAERL